MNESVIKHFIKLDDGEKLELFEEMYAALKEARKYINTRACPATYLKICDALAKADGK